MSHLSVRTLLGDVAKSLDDSVQFGYGRRSEFNMIDNKKYPYIWLLPLSASRRFINNNTTKTRTWNVQLVFLDVDKADANEDQTTEIHDTLDIVVAKYMQALDDWYERSYDTVGALTIQNDNQQPFYKDDAGIHSGWLLTFQLVVSDDFNYCVEPNISVYAGNI